MLQRIGRYEILERIGGGAFGKVYRARDTVLDRVVAVKGINQPGADGPEFLESLQHEPRLAARLTHDKPFPWAVGFFFGNTELSLELWTVIAGVSEVDD